MIFSIPKILLKIVIIFSTLTIIEKFAKIFSVLKINPLKNGLLQK